VKHVRFGRFRFRCTFQCEPLAPHGWRSLSRSIPTSRVQCRSRRHRLFGSDTERQLPAPWCRLAPNTASHTCENQAPTQGRGLGAKKHGRNAFCRVDARSTLFVAFSMGAKGFGCDTVVLHSRTRSRRSLSDRIPSRWFDDRCEHRYVTRRRHVRAFVTRSAGGPAQGLSTERDQRTKDTYDRLLPKSLESIGHPDPRGFRLLARCR